MGVTEYASGEVGYTADGLIETYTVASGDSLIAIGERFCVDYVTVGAYNDRFGSKVIQPGDVLVLRP
jgi:LysM repeat protein